MVRAKRAAATCPTTRPIVVLPVAEMSAMRRSAHSAAPTSRPPCSTCDKPSGACSNSRATPSKIACTATAVSGVFSDGFQITLLPHTKANAAFQAHTATGKLNAEITSVGPSGCQLSSIRCPGRSLAMVNPYNCRDSPTAKSQMSIISCTSPSASDNGLPHSMVTRRARSSLCTRKALPNCLTSSPRRGAGTLRHWRKAAADKVSAMSMSVGVASATEPIWLPSMGL